MLDFVPYGAYHMSSANSCNVSQNIVHAWHDVMNVVDRIFTLYIMQVASGFQTAPINRMPSLSTYCLVGAWWLSLSAYDPFLHSWHASETETTSTLVTLSCSLPASVCSNWPSMPLLLQIWWSSSWEQCGFSVEIHRFVVRRSPRIVVNSTFMQLVHSSMCFSMWCTRLHSCIPVLWPPASVTWITLRASRTAHRLCDIGQSFL